MLKLGVYRLDQYPWGSGVTWKTRARWMLARNRIALPLLRTPATANPSQVAVFERLVRHVCLSSGIYRTTFRGRFDALNESVNAALAREFKSTDALRVEDWAASDCLTSAEWAQSLFPLFPSLSLTTSDFMLFLAEVTLPSGEVFIVEPGGALLQYIRPPFVIRLSPPEPSSMVVNSMLAKSARRKWKQLQMHWNPPAAWMNADVSEPWQQGSFSCRKISLVHPEARALQASDARFKVRQHSVFEASQNGARGPAQVIRTMNILNLSYFPHERLKQGVRAVLASLAPGGVWLVGRTFEEKPPRHNASLLKKENGGFRVIERWGEGSEIEDLALAEA